METASAAVKLIRIGSLSKKRKQIIDWKQQAQQLS